MKNKNFLKVRIARCFALLMPITLLISPTVTACSSKWNDNHVFAQSSPTSVSDRSLIASTYKSHQQVYNVGIVDNLILKDAQRNRQIPIKVSYPEGQQGSFPVIVFSHGAGASKDDYAPLTRFWASQGYICIQPTHGDSIALNRQQGNSENLRESIRQMLGDAKGWKDRATDISFIISSLSELERQAPQLKGKMNTQRIGVGGHSYGAYTAQLVGGATIDIPGGAKAQSFADHRVRAVLLLSPQGTGQQGLTRNSWAKINLPMMTMTGSKDRGAQGQGPDWKEEPFKYSPAGEKYLVFIEGASHFSFSGRFADGGQARGETLGRQRGWRLRERFGGGDRRFFGGGQQQEGTIFSYVKTASLSFWDAYLKQDSKAKEFLKSDALNSESNGDVSISFK
ncbi:alpha/beta hydrolase family protein [Fischerella thermalis]|nr:alpha/beta fold hydrolase [Fischerella thermalis]